MGLDLRWLGQRIAVEVGLLLIFFFEDLIAQADALIANVHRGPLDNLLDLIDSLAAE